MGIAICLESASSAGIHHCAFSTYPMICENELLDKHYSLLMIKPLTYMAS